jgi:hypothetical protein
MSNKWWKKDPAMDPPTQKHGQDRSAVKRIRTMNWPGVPGRTGKDRSAGVKRVKGHAASEGI